MNIFFFNQTFSLFCFPIKIFYLCKVTPIKNITRHPVQFHRSEIPETKTDKNTYRRTKKHIDYHPNKYTNKKKWSPKHYTLIHIRRIIWPSPLKNYASRRMTTILTTILWHGSDFTNIAIMMTQRAKHYISIGPLSTWRFWITSKVGMEKRIFAKGGGGVI